MDTVAFDDEEGIYQRRNAGVGIRKHGDDVDERDSDLGAEEGEGECPVARRERGYGGTGA